MRLWHKDLIAVLPRQQLLGQWRECCLIAKNIANKGTTNHILVNKVMDYPIDHFMTYCILVRKEMIKRGYKCINKPEEILHPFPYARLYDEEIFADWHNERYLKQCFYNLQEKYDCDGISKDEWDNVETKVLCLLSKNNVL